ncbi:CtIP type zinc knuckle (C2H2) [Cryptosporidium ryanae]|uniref:CtIP type zinc knuckle (C2H2) n=1 Tax=Cryptosporidium ryanae TaxID=515981 RepID=UPI00351A6F9B|nr:CtIP type zinc knuckle (C2H2) [Cryptosporidium ryanae]
MIDPLDEDEYPSSFPLEKIVSHLKISLTLLENAHVQWLSEKESLIHELERLRMENRALRMEMRNNENIERNSVPITPIGNRSNYYYVVDQETGNLVKVSPVNSHNFLNKTEADISIQRNVLDVQNVISPDYTEVKSNKLNSMFLNNDNASSPILNSQNCRVRKIQVEDEQNDNDSMNTGSKKGLKNNDKKKGLSEKNESLELNNTSKKIGNTNLINDNIITATNSNTKNTIKYKEVGKNIGKRDSRNNLQAFECTECSKFYKAINSHNPSNYQTFCKHMKKNYLLQNSGRHRYKNQPTKSPPGFWDVDDL